MQRPEDIELSPAAQRLASQHGIALPDVKHAAAGSQLYDWIEHEDGRAWGAAEGLTPQGRKLFLMFGPSPKVVATLRPAP